MQGHWQAGGACILPQFFLHKFLLMTFLLQAQSFVPEREGSSADGHVGLQTRCSIAVGWLTCPVGFCSLLNHLTKEKGEGKPAARLPAVASSVLQHQLLGGFDQEFVASQDFLLFLWKCSMKGRPVESVAPF